VTIWNPAYDLLPDKRDYPCTILHQFRIRDNKLNMSVYMRSNDVWLGAAYDFFQFTRVQIAMASVLGIEPGTYSHHVGSLHIYEQHYEAAAKLEYCDKKDYPSIPAITGNSWSDIKSNAHLALVAAQNGLVRGTLDSDVFWYADSMATAILNNQRKEKQ